MSPRKKEDSFKTSVTWSIDSCRKNGKDNSFEHRDTDLQSFLYKSAVVKIIIDDVLL